VGSPRFPIPVVRLFVPDTKGRVLLLRRGVGTSQGLWCLPGGKVEHGQTTEDTIRLELREETGLDLLSSRFLFFQESLPSDPAMDGHFLDLYFECEWSGEIKLNYESEAASWVGEWASRRRQLAFGNDRALARYWLSHPQRKR